jgi:hypothetical protein
VNQGSREHLRFVNGPWRKDDEGIVEDIERKTGEMEELT